MTHEVVVLIVDFLDHALVIPRTGLHAPAPRRHIPATIAEATLSRQTYSWACQDGCKRVSGPVFPTCRVESPFPLILREQVHIRRHGICCVDKLVRRTTELITRYSPRRLGSCRVSGAILNECGKRRRAMQQQSGDGTKPRGNPFRGI